MLRSLASCARQLVGTSAVALRHCSTPRIAVSPTRLLPVLLATMADDAAAADTPSKRQRKPTGRVQSAVKAAEEAISPHQVSEESSTPRAKRTPAKRPRPSPQQKAKQPEGSELPGASDAGGDGSAAGLADAVKGADRVSVQAPPKPKRTPQPAQLPPGTVAYDISMRPPRYEGPALRFLSWNVAGMRALVGKDAAALRSLMEAETLDALLLQEHKLQETHIDKVIADAGLQGWHVTFNCSTAKKGYAGVATLCREKPLSVRLGIGMPEHDDEGRVVTVELPDLWLVNVYTPNSGEGLKRLDYRTSQWDVVFAEYVKGLRSGAGGKPVVVAGDLNCAHQPIDIHDPKRNLRSAGFTQEERDSFGTNLLSGAGLVDTYRMQHPQAVGYTYYSYRMKGRETGKGWRLDYMLVSEELASAVHDSYILKHVTGSDHVPLGIVIKRG